ncbi:MAG: hypothetical protein FD131_3958 [Rhodocyclaceae bacterium]|nr:MAG: hypothetical protein FD131_3958 [Rhodocyclaceae bacterium]
MNALPTLLRESEVAQLLGMKNQTLQVWRTQGQGPSFLKIGRYVRYDRETVMAWINARERQHTGGRGDYVGRAEIAKRPCIRRQLQPA